MPKLTIEIDNIFNGLMPSESFGENGQFESSIGIDPDMPRTDESGDVQTAGVIRPVNYVSFSGSNIDSHPIAVLTNPKNALTYVVLANGKLLSYDDFESETVIGTTVPGSANGAFYYNNYIYITTGTDVSRYGPLSGTPTLTNGVWTGSTLGTQTALTNTAYPKTLFGTTYLNHHGIIHVDGAAYFLDFKSGVGMVHKILTALGTVEGDTDNGSAYNILDLPFNYLPITIAPFGNDLVVAASFTKDTDTLQGRSALFFFNPSDTIPSFYRIVHLPDALCSALIYANGILYGLSGDINGGYRLFQYIGGDTIQTMKMMKEGNLPLQNAIYAVSNKIVWAADTTKPMNASGLWGYGSKSDLFPRGLHHIAVTNF